MAAVLTIGLASMAHGMLQIILTFEIKSLPGHLDDLALQFDDSGSAHGLRLRERPDGAPVNMAERTERRALSFVAGGATRFSEPR